MKNALNAAKRCTELQTQWLPALLPTDPNERRLLCIKGAISHTQGSAEKPKGREVQKQRVCVWLRMCAPVCSQACVHSTVETDTDSQQTLHAPVPPHQPHGFSAHFQTPGFHHCSEQISMTTHTCPLSTSRQNKWYQWIQNIIQQPGKKWHSSVYS